MRLENILLASLVAMASFTPSFAAPSGSGTAPANASAGVPTVTLEPNPNLSAKKKALILDLLKLTEADKTVDKVVSHMMAAHQKQYPLMVAQIVNADPDLTDVQKKDLIEKSQTRAARSSERLKELFLSKINLGDVMNKVAIVVYDKNFSEQELQDIIAFYNTPTGQKTLKQMPSVIQESMEMTTALISPQMGQIITQVMEEERAKLKAADKPAAPATTTK